MTANADGNVLLLVPVSTQISREEVLCFIRGYRSATWVTSTLGSMSTITEWDDLSLTFHSWQTERDLSKYFYISLIQIKFSIPLHAVSRTTAVCQDWVWSLFFLAIIIFHTDYKVAVGAPHAGVSPPLPGWCRSPRSLSLPHSWLPLCEAACSPPCRSWCSRPRAGTVSAGSSCRSPSPQQQSLCCCPCGCQNSYTFKSIRNLVFLHNSFESVS